MTCASGGGCSLERALSVRMVSSSEVSEDDRPRSSIRTADHSANYALWRKVPWKSETKVHTTHLSRGERVGFFLNAEDQLIAVAGPTNIPIIGDEEFCEYIWHRPWVLGENAVRTLEMIVRLLGELAEAYLTR